MDDSRPNPDLILDALKIDAARSGGGRLSIFFGMAAGVGKTYAMLQAAREQKQKGVDVVVGLVETHGRAETAALLEGLPVIPRRQAEYRETRLEEMDLDAILARRPELVIIDELAHTNVPGSRHPKRWQDVIEVLDAGIDAYTTLNVQHLESRKDTVEGITGITIRESVPDSVLERAARIVLIDIGPPELLQRLREGKVYLGERAEVAMEHFFKEDRLTALREVALRYTAERVDHDLHALRAAGHAQSGWRPTERLMVAVSHSPTSEKLIRATRRLAYNLEAPWIAVHVDTGQTLTPSDREALSRNIALVRDLGGDLVSVAQTDVAAALRRVASERQVTQLVIGRPTRRWLRDFFSMGTIIDRLVTRAGGFDLLVLGMDAAPRPPSPVSRLGSSLSLAELGKALGVLALVSILAALLKPVVGYRTTGFIILFGVIGISLFARIGIVVVSAIFAALLWDVLFIPPFGTLHIDDPADLIMCAAFLIVALTTGALTQRMRESQRLLRRQEGRLRILLDVAQTMAMRRTHEEYLPAAALKLGDVIDCDCSVAVLEPSGAHRPAWFPATDWVGDVREQAVIDWAIQNRTAAGWSTATLPAAAALYIPLGSSDRVVGILTCRPRTSGKLVPEEESLLAAVAHQVEVALERELLQQTAHQVDRLRESERLHQTILNSVSHEIRTPLTALIGMAAQLEIQAKPDAPGNSGELVRGILENSDRLNRVIENLLDLSRLDSGYMSLRRDWHDPADIVGVALESSRRFLVGHKIRVDMPERTPLVRIDLRLMEHALVNLLANAAAYAPAGTTIGVGAAVRDGWFEVWVSDEGPGIPEDSLERVFERFYRLPSRREAGTGIGLSIVRGIVELHGGGVTASNNPKGGCRFTIRLPLEDQPPIPQEGSKG